MSQLRIVGVAASCSPRRFIVMKLLPLACILTWTCYVQAQQNTDGNPSSPSEADKKPAASTETKSKTDSETLGTVLVTAEKRTEDIKEVPYSVSVVSGEELENRHISDIEDISRMTPGMSFGSGGNTGKDVITIRGISSQGGNATVGIFLDDISLVTQNSFNQSYSGATQPLLFDLDRIEILRGPQGTLYGASSMGGAIKYVTNRPDLDNLTGTVNIDGSLTQHGGLNYDVSGVVNLPIIPGVFAIRAGIDFRDTSGYIDRYAYVPPTQASLNEGIDDSRPGPLIKRGTDDERTTAFHVIAEYKVNDDFSITPAVFGQQQKAGDTSVFYPQLGLYNQDKLVPEKSKDTMYVPSVTIKNNFGWADLTAQASYFYRKNAQTNDGTYYSSTFIEYLADFDPTHPDTNACDCGAPFWNLPGPSVTSQTTKTKTIEVRLASKPIDESGLPFTWLAGVIGSERKIHVIDNEYVTGVRNEFIKLYGILPEDSSFADPFPNDSVGYGYSTEKLHEEALFGEAAYYVTPALKFTMGLRQARDHTSYVNDQGGYFSQGVPPHEDLANHYSFTTPKFAVSYDLNEDDTIYANATKGSRVGGYIYPFATTVGLCPAGLAEYGISAVNLSYGPDSLWSYEVGAKTKWFGDHLSVNASGYYIDWSNIQQSFILPCGAQITANYGSAVSKGGELEILAKPMHGLTLGLVAGKTSAKLTSVVPGVGAEKGDKLLNAPNFMLTLSAEYDWRPMEGVYAFVRGDFDRTGVSHGSYIPDSILYNRPAYSLWNGSFGVNFHNITLTAYAKNLGNNQKIIQLVQIEALNSGYVPRPRTIGAQAKFDF